MSCTGYGDCRQGRAPCRTPLTCSGAPVDEAIEAFRRALPARSPAVPQPLPDDFDEDVGLPVAVAAVVAAIGVGFFICAGVGVHAIGRYLGLF